MIKTNSPVYRIISIILLTLISSCVAYPTAWFEVRGNDGIGRTTFYVDPTSIRKSGDKAIMWTLIDHSSVQKVVGNKFLSQKSQEEYKCNAKQVKMLYYSWHSENMGGGAFTENRPQMDWAPVAPESMGEVMWKLACGK